MAAPAQPLPTEVNAESSSIWQKLVEMLKSQDKAPVLACIEKSEFRGISGSQFFLVFHSPMLKQLTERNYRRLLEPVLRRVGIAFLRLAGSAAGVSVEWSNINLQDETEYAQARLWNAQAAQLEQQLENC